jgi:hypothetical protein
MKEDSLSTKDMLLNIGSMRHKALRLADQKKKYSELLRIILEKDFYYDDNESIPSLKELSSATGLKYGKIRKLIEEAYSDLVLNYETKAIFSFTKIRYEFLMRGWQKEKFLALEADQLPVVPRVGEQVSLPFFSAHLGEKHFYVEKIDHKFEEDAQIISIWLRAGTYNSYWHYRKDKAQEENELPFFDFIKMDDFELKKKLKVGV